MSSASVENDDARRASSERVDRPKVNRSRKGELTAERILDAAEELFAERGYAGTTLRDVARGVGIRIPSLYNHFESKEALYAAVLRRGLEPALRTLSEQVVGEGGRVEDPRELVRSMLKVMVEHPRLAALVQHETLTGGAHVTPMLRSWLAPIFARADEMVSTGLRGSRWDSDELSLLMLAFYHVIVGYFAIAPLYRIQEGRDLLSEEMLAKQQRVFSYLVELIFEDLTPEAPSEP